MNVDYAYPFQVFIDTRQQRREPNVFELARLDVWYKEFIEGDHHYEVLYQKCEQARFSKRRPVRDRIAFILKWFWPTLLLAGLSAVAVAPALFLALVLVPIQIGALAWLIVKACEWIPMIAHQVLTDEVVGEE